MAEITPSKWGTKFLSEIRKTAVMSPKNSFAPGIGFPQSVLLTGMPPTPLKHFKMASRESPGIFGISHVSPISPIYP